MAKKLLKDNPLKKDGLLGNIISDKSESKNSDIQESKNSDIERKIKVSFYLPYEDDELIEEIRRKLNKKRQNKLSRSDIIHEAIKLLAEKELGK